MIKTLDMGNEGKQRDRACWAVAANERHEVLGNNRHSKKVPKTSEEDRVNSDVQREKAVE